MLHCAYCLIAAICNLHHEAHKGTLEKPRQLAVSLPQLSETRQLVEMCANPGSDTHCAPAGSPKG